MLLPLAVAADDAEELALRDLDGDVVDGLEHVEATANGTDAAPAP